MKHNRSAVIAIMALLACGACGRERESSGALPAKSADTVTVERRNSELAEVVGGEEALDITASEVEHAIADASGLEISGTVVKGYYRNSTEDYHVSIHVINDRGVTFSYDLAEGGFYPSQGTPLLARTGAPLGKRQALPVRRLEPGKYESFGYDTAGFTYRLMNDSSGPLKFSFRFALRGENVAGPVTAVLPDLREVPRRDEVERGMKSPTVLLFGTEPPR